MQSVRESAKGMHLTERGKVLSLLKPETKKTLLLVLSGQVPRGVILLESLPQSIKTGGGINSTDPAST